MDAGFGRSQNSAPTASVFGRQRHAAGRRMINLPSCVARFLPHRTDRDDFTTLSDLSGTLALALLTFSLSTTTGFAQQHSSDSIPFAGPAGPQQANDEGRTELPMLVRRSISFREIGPALSGGRVTTLARQNQLSACLMKSGSIPSRSTACSKAPTMHLRPLLLISKSCSSGSISPRSGSITSSLSRRWQPSIAKWLGTNLSASLPACLSNPDAW